MSKGKVYFSNCPDEPPEWYWESGLHDACIMKVETFEFPFDYSKFVGKKDKHNRNLMTLKIDAEGAMYDTEVTEIRLFNYKILSDISPENKEEIWWMADRLEDHGDFYTLEIDLWENYKDYTVKIKFERAEVDRKAERF